MKKTKNLPPNSPQLLLCGGGPVALATALKLVAAGIRVEVVGMPPARAPERKVITTTALAFSSVRFLREVGLEVAKVGQPIHAIRVLDNGLAALEFKSDELPHRQPFGYVIDNRRLWQRLHALAAAEANLRLSVNAASEISDFRQDAYRAHVKLADGGEKSAAVVIAADGRESILRRLGGFAIVRKHYEQEAVQCVVAHERPHRQTAWEYFLPEGPLALLPMTGENRSAVVWSLPRGRGAALATDRRSLEEALNRKAADLVGECRLLAEPLVRKLSLVHAVHPVERRLALVGDAACAIHPIAGQGFNLALRGAEALVESLGAAKRLGLDLAAGLKDYAAAQRTDATLMAAATDLLNLVFSYESPPIAAARALGVWLVGKTPPLKRALVRTAMGV